MWVAQEASTGCLPRVFILLLPLIPLLANVLDSNGSRQENGKGTAVALAAGR